VTTSVQVHGLRELREALIRKVPEHFQGRVLQKALSSGARPVLRTARQLAARGKTGVLRRSIYSARDKSSSNGIFEQKIISVRSGKKLRKSGKDAFYWRFIEFGRGPVVAGQRLRKGRLGATRNSRTDATVLGTSAKGFFGKQVAAAPARPFLRPAFDRNKRQALDGIQKSLAAEIPKAARKAAWRTPSR
jgi:HK97 gp10 family phage protein